MRKRTTAPGAMACAVALLAIGLGVGRASDAGAGTRLWAVGDGGVEGREDNRMAARVASLGIDRLLYLGDVYESGTAREYATNYASSWGRFKRLTSPTPGNHEWGNHKVGYDPYWGRRARGPGGVHYYSFDLDGWHVVSLNSEEGVGSSLPQLAWLRRDLSRYGGTCTMAFWHRPRYDAGSHDDAEEVEPFWRALAGRATVVLNGHDHNYQRFRPVRGITQFIAGGGGRAPLNEVDPSDSRLAAFDNSSLGALRLGLRRSEMTYGYRRLNGSRSDSGMVACRPHRPAVAISSPADGSVVPRGSSTLTGRARGYAGALRIAPAPHAAWRVLCLRRGGLSAFALPVAAIVSPTRQGTLAAAPFARPNAGAGRLRADGEGDRSGRPPRLRDFSLQRWLKAPPARGQRLGRDRSTGGRCGRPRS